MGIAQKAKKGDRYGHLTFNQLAYSDGRRCYYSFTCDCGKECVKLIANLRNTSSCGCKAFEARSAARKRRPVMALEHYRIHQVWENMKQRCLNQNSTNYKNYGGRGIGIYAEWFSFKPFLNWALLNGYSDNLTLNRKDNDGNYSPDNCEWITNMEQQSNTRKTVKITYKGETLHLAEWARRSGVHRAILGDRIKRWGDIERALTTPVKHHGRRSV